MSENHEELSLAGSNAAWKEFEAFGFRLRVMTLESTDNVEVTLFAFRNDDEGYIRERFDFLVPKERFLDTEDFYIHLFIRELADHWTMISRKNQGSDIWDPWIPNEKAEAERAEWLLKWAVESPEEVRKRID